MSSDQQISDALLQEALLYSRYGNNEAALSLCQKVLALMPNSSEAYGLMTSIMLPGEPYDVLLRRFHEYLHPRTYVEIGVECGDSLTLVQEGTLALGIDPAPQIVHPLRPTTKVFAETSDDFFAKHDLNAELGGQPIDLAFIDGMHWFEFALRDFMNIERHASPDSTILYHDCYPPDEITAARERVTAVWCGDVWKLTLCLKKYRPDLVIYTIATFPSGLGIVRNLDPRSTVLQDNLQRICDEFIPLPYDTIAKKKPYLLNLYPNDWSAVQALLE